MFVDTVEEMKALDGTTYPRVSFRGYWAAGDSGGGEAVYTSATLAADEGSVFAGTTSAGGYWIRQFSPGPVYAQWFGVVNDGVDRTGNLQSAIDYVVVNSLALDIGRGRFPISTPLNIGTTNGAAQYGSFKISGQKATYINNTGTQIVYTPMTAINAMVTVQRSAFRFLEFNDIHFLVDHPGVASYGFLFATTYFSGVVMRGIRSSNGDKAFAVLDGGGANGEFIKMYECIGDGGTGFFYMDSASGQSYRHSFINCQGGLASAGSLFEIGSTNGGYGIYVENFNGTNIELAQQMTLLKYNGASENCTFIGGRIEHLSTIFYNNGASHAGAKVRFVDMSLAGMQVSAARPLIQGLTAATEANMTVEMDGCLFGSYNTFKDADFQVNLPATDRTVYRFRDCTFGIAPGIGLPRSASSGRLILENLSVYYANASGQTVGYKKVSKYMGYNRQTPLTHSLDSESPNNFGGIPDNQLIYPDFGTVFGSNVVAPSPWTHTGTTLAFLLLASPVAVGGLSSGPGARQINMAPTSGVKQCLDGITLAANVPVFFQALVNVRNSGRTARFALEDTDGNILDEYLYTVPNTTDQGNYTYTPQVISLMAVPTAATGNPVLKIENLSSAYAVFMIHWQFISENPLASYTLPAPGITQSMTGYWNSNVDSQRVFGRLALPHKSDLTGSAALTTLKDVESDIYLSNVDERVVYFANQAWWRLPRQTIASSVPTSGSWTAGDYVQCVPPVVSGNAVTKGWIRLTTGSGNVLGTGTGPDWFSDMAVAVS